MSERLGRDRTNGLLLVAVMVAIMWVAEVVDAVAGGRLDAYGIHPRDVDGLPEIAAAPFLHAGFGHLLSNTVPFTVMGVAIALGGLARIATVTVVVALVSGLGTWLIASPDSIHLGASGVVFGYATYLVSRGLLSRRLVDLAVGALVVVVWGVALAQGLLPQERISWQAHMFGAIGGVLAASLLAGRRARPRAAAHPRS